MSAYDRLTGVKRLRVRGLKAVSCCATLKAVGVNLFRATAVRRARRRALETHEGWLEASRYLNMDLLKEHKKLRISLAA